MLVLLRNRENPLVSSGATHFIQGLKHLSQYPASDKLPERMRWPKIVGESLKEGLFSEAVISVQKTFVAHTMFMKQML
jgi:hypothetical protein